ncbi:MAG: DAK2 domain-containing protein [Deltaproteobacteria bacterium]|jgi:dihydroxyacetone kinase-like predicted kinase|nr:DAK2 domain-containing protein [Deltaproteobacteria bacterium]
MNDTFRQALVAGYECLAAWADLLDRINVFPIADGDTGRNLVISLSPLRGPERDISELRKELLRSARGNSGNIASAFFRCFLTGDNADQLPDAVRRGRDEAWRSVPDPRPGTMLTFFDTLTECFQKPWSGETLSGLRIRLEDAVRATITQQPQLRRAGVVDAGALGMYLFFEGFMPVYAGGAPVVRSVTETFGDLVRLSPSYCDEPERGYCVDVMIETGGDAHQAEARPSLPGESIVVSRRGKCLKIHLHTHDLEEVRSRLRPLGKILGWAEDDLYRQTANFNRPGRDDSVHIMTDAAGSLTREEAALMDVSLLDSYIVIGKQCLPETCLAPSVLYDAMRSGIRVSTSQASVFERHQHYTNVMGRHERVLYLCVGSAYTGNYETAVAWKKTTTPKTG